MFVLIGLEDTPSNPTKLLFILAHIPLIFAYQFLIRHVFEFISTMKRLLPSTLSFTGLTASVGSIRLSSTPSRPVLTLSFQDGVTMTYFLEMRFSARTYVPVSFTDHPCLILPRPTVADSITRIYSSVYMLFSGAMPFRSALPITVEFEDIAFPSVML